MSFKDKAKISLLKIKSLTKLPKVGLSEFGLVARSKIYDYIFVPLAAVVLAIVIRTFIFDNFHVPSGSMMNTLLIGDKITISKMSYGYSRYSFPFGIVPIKGRILGSEPSRGDIVVFKLPSNKRINYVKRLIGLPGDKIQIKEGEVIINGDKLKRREIDPLVIKDHRMGREVAFKRYVETLPNNVSYTVLDLYYNPVSDDTKTFRVPKGHYFFLGDNRDNSKDSRFSDVGFVSGELLLGKVKFVMISSEKPLINPFNWLGIRGDRFLANPYKEEREEK